MLLGKENTNFCADDSDDARGRWACDADSKASMLVSSLSIVDVVMMGADASGVLIVADADVVDGFRDAGLFESY